MWGDGGKVTATQSDGGNSADGGKFLGPKVHSL
jgi:hypothetical protein